MIQSSLYNSSDATRNLPNGQLAVPDRALVWLVQHGCYSNRDLMCISNVCQRWRDIVLSVIFDMIQSALLISDDRSQSLTLWKECYHTVSQLLLPDMALEILKRRLKSATHDHHPLCRMESEFFCLAWFHPLGINIQAVDLSDNHDDDDSSNNRKEARKPVMAIQTVSDEWYGYRNATDVLIPLGYSTSFVRAVLNKASNIDIYPEILSSKTDNIHSTTALTHTQTPWYTSLNTERPRNQNEFSDMYDKSSLTKQRRTSFAVRGCTFARPFGYCLCWTRADEDAEHLSLDSQLKKLDLNDDNQRRHGYRLQHMKQNIERFERKRRMRLRECLPRVVMSTKAKYPDLQGYSGEIEGIRQRSIQFLNADKSRAVYMRTSPFDCGEITSAVTMFVVAIALEDGCFVSGLEKRFELGHLYGDQLDTEIEMSPICIATQSNSTDSGLTRKQMALKPPKSSFDKSNSSSDDSDDDDDFQIDSHCKCKIQCNRNYEVNSDDSDPGEEFEPVDEKRIIRGSLGPGKWHLYTAIFNGKNSLIRVDGVSEPVDTSHIDHDDFPVLDGLTIGSDHIFDMSLCFGEGSDGEGEGSISEIAVFRGAMATDDLEQIEKFLLKKHGIIHGDDRYLRSHTSQMDIIPETSEVTMKIPTQVNQWQENKWTKDAHALMVHAPPFEVSTGVPLRVAARHRTVAWSRMCEVTGKPLHVSRIGAKNSNGSSDW